MHSAGKSAGEGKLIELHPDLETCKHSKGLFIFVSFSFLFFVFWHWECCWVCKVSWLFWNGHMIEEVSVGGELWGRAVPSSYRVDQAMVVKSGPPWAPCGHISGHSGQIQVICLLNQIRLNDMKILTMIIFDCGCHSLFQLVRLFLLLLFKCHVSRLSFFFLLLLLGSFIYHAMTCFTF